MPITVTKQKATWDKVLKSLEKSPSFVNYLVKFWRINYKIINQY